MTAEDAKLIEVVMEMFRELSADVRSLRNENKRDHIVQREATAALDKKVTEALRRLDVHDKWHGKNDVQIAQRLEVLLAADHDELVAETAVSRYKQRFAWLGSVGIDAAKAGAIAVSGAALLGLGWLLRVVFG